jgi:predicted nucleotide-binding protein (sugar kinase/HSP70/actin superfamily)
LGKEAVSGKECYPCLLTAGDMLKTLKWPGFNPKSAAFFMPTGTGPCRFGQYAHFHRRILDEWGYPEIPIFSPNQDGEYYEKLGMVANDFILWAWRGLVAVDVLEELLRQTRPYENKKREADRVYKHYLEEVCFYLRSKMEPLPLLAQAVMDFRKIKLELDKPIVGVVGEIYLRSNPFANENLVRQLEALGAEVKLPPMEEWIFYTNHTALLRAWRSSYLKRTLRLLSVTIIQHKEQWRFREKAKPVLKYNHEPLILQLLHWARPYLHPAFEGEAVLTIGKAIDFLKKEAQGIINVMPFTCMPGSIAQSIFSRVQREKNAFPCLHLSFDGQEQTNTQTRLEAFMYQVKQRYSQLKADKL